MPSITIKLFAQAREESGQDKVRLDVESPCTVAQVRRLLARRHPTLMPLLERSALAVNHEYAREDRTLHEGDEIAVIPPVAGG